MKTSSTTHGESKTTTTSTPPIMKSERLVTRPGSMLTSVRDERRNNRATCKITTETDDGISYGTGSLILARGGIPCILTNHHVLPNKKVAKISRARFFDDYDDEILSLKFDVNTFFVTHPESCSGTDNCYESHMQNDKGLDFTLVALENSDHLKRFDPLLMSHDINVPNGASLSTFGYPSGGPKCRSQGDAVGLSDCKRYIQYEFSTQSGSSGSPVFMDGRFVALHHSFEQDPRDSSKFVNVGSTFDINII